MPEKFDFSKIEDRNKFEELPKKDQDKIINEAEEEAATIKEIVDDDKAADYAGAERMNDASKNWQRGHLGVTAKDHLAFGGSPDIELSRNPGKTLGELWSIEKISEKLNGRVDFLEKSRKEYKEIDPHHPDAHWSRDNIRYTKKELKITIPYLKSIGKLPKEFENFEVQDLEGDPKK